VEWEVWEVNAAVAQGDKDEITGEYPAYKRTSWLCFYSQDQRRRLAEYPFKWYKLGEPELISLLERSVPSKITPHQVAHPPGDIDRSA
jgi:hypothetical protein